MEAKGYQICVLIPYSKESMLREVIDADAIIVGLETIDKEIIATGKQLKVIAKHGVGVDNIDLNAASKHGIYVTNTPSANNEAVADLAFGLLLSVARKIPEANQQLKNNKWQRYDGHSVWGKTLGIIGLGAIGKGVARRASGFSMKILGYDVSEPAVDERSIGIERVTLEQLIRTSDYISLHVPLNQHTRGIIAQKELAMMKSTAILINTARGGLIDEEALYQALKNKQIQGCGLDVFEEEPPTDEKLLQLNNIVVTPHIAAYTIEAVQLTSEITAQNVMSILENRTPQHVVNLHLLAPQ